MDQQSTIEEFLERSAASTLLRFSTAGSVDDGKSTLIGRLLHDSKNIYDDHLNALKKKSEATSPGSPLSLALLTDGLKAEQEQGITIDVAYRYFATPRRRFILADTPGHEQYTRNMATGASTADLTIVLIDARTGVTTQTKRHSFIASLLGVPRLLVAVNKMDLVDYSQSVFDSIQEDYLEFASRLEVQDIRFTPISALNGDNVVNSSPRMPWYKGESILDYLEHVYIGSDGNLVDFRFPVQTVIRPHQDFRGYAGQISSGTIRVGEEIVSLPSMKRSTVKGIHVMGHDSKDKSLTQASAPESIVITLSDNIDVARGNMIVRSKNVPQVKSQFEAMVVWMTEAPLNLSKSYLVMHTTRTTKAFIDEVHYRVDVNNMSRLPSSPLSLNEIGRVTLTTTTPLFLDPYKKNRATGNFIIVDSDDFSTVGAGLILDRLPEELITPTHHRDVDIPQTSENLHLETGSVSREDREAKLGFASRTLWLTGLSGSGKSSIAKALEQKLFAEGRAVYRLDGDNLRHGLNKDLGFSKGDRTENIRRVSEIAKLMNDAGVTVICSFISPFQKDREMAREIVGEQSFLEVYLSTPLEVCESRDPHGLYRKARTGELKEFTGVSSPYEPPSDPAITIDTSKESIDSAVQKILVSLPQKQLPAKA